MEMANYIYSILRNQLNIVWSWGFNTPTALSNGLKFKVQGFKHSGWVVVLYNDSTDLFDISLFNTKMEVIQKIDGVHFDMLLDTIDFYVERVDNYENKVKQTYSLL